VLRRSVEFTTLSAHRQNFAGRPLGQWARAGELSYSWTSRGRRRPPHDLDRIFESRRRHPADHLDAVILPDRAEVPLAVGQHHDDARADPHEHETAALGSLARPAIDFGIVGLLRPGCWEVLVDGHLEIAAVALGVEHEFGPFGLPFRAERGVQHPQTEEGSTRVWTLIVDAAAPTEYDVLAPDADRFLQFRDVRKLAAHRTSATGPAGDDRRKVNCRHRHRLEGWRSERPGQDAQPSL
jgi:hypothetical protein